MAIAGISRFSLLALLVAIFVGCTDPDEKIETDPAFGEFVFAYTSGVISANDPILVQLAQPYDGALKTDNALPDNLFDFEPPIQGKAIWLNESTLKFIPNDKLPGNTIYLGKLNLSTLMDVPNGLKTFQFQFQTIRQDLSVYVDGLDAYSSTDLSRVMLNGKIHTADVINAEDIKKAISIVQGDKNLEFSMVSESDRTFGFTVENIVRGEERSKVNIHWSLTENEEKITGEKIIEIPSISDFEVMNVKVDRGTEQAVTVYFSDPLAQQKLDAIVTVEDVPNLKYLIDGNALTIYPQSKVNGQKLLRINGAIKNIADKNMGTEYSASIAFELEKPAVRLIGNKSIIPTQKQGLVFPFEAVSLEGVDVYITKIFSNNILQYLQSADHGESYYLNRVGRHIYRKHINLRQAGGADLYSWNRYYVDLSEIINADPGALYEVDIRFKQKDAVYICDDTENTEETDNLTTRNQGWISDGTYFVDDYWKDYRYDWEEQENPCHSAYYSRYTASAKRVVMATNIGLTAKMGGDKNLFVSVNDLRTTTPFQAATIKVYDYQQQLIAETLSDEKGFANIKCPREPFAIVVSSTNDKTYLKINQGNALSLSKFDVAGQHVQDGIKGFIYGERGVWRPGDSLYLNFILEDSEKILPPAHPVEMELYNPLGQLVTRSVKTKSTNGFYDFRTATTTEAPTGDYRMNISVGNRSFNKNLKIETVKPNRLKINFDFDDVQPNAKNLKGVLEAKWLHGATATNLTADVTMSLRGTKTSFKGFENYHFDNNIREDFNTESTEIFAGKLNAEGKAHLNIDMGDKTQNAPGMLKASFSTKVYETGGNFSVDYHSIDYAPYASFAGMELPESDMWGDALETDEQHIINLVSVNAQGKASNTKQLHVKVFRIDNHWWYDRYNGNTYNYLNSSYYREYKSEDVALTNGRGSFNILIPENNWGRYLIHVEDKVSGHTSAQFVYFDWPYWMRANRKDGDAATILGFSSDKDNYNVGESVKLTFPSPENGRALISIENGTKILEKFWVETESGETKFEFKTTAAMSPNVFAHISLLQPHSQTINDRPIRMYGVIPIPVENPESRLKPEIIAAEVLRPETTAKIGVKEADGKPMTYTLAVVDEGLLGLTRFKTPNPWDAFYAREALGVQTWDMYDDVIGALADGDGNVLSIGGDEDAVDPGKQKAIRFKPVVRFLGPFNLEAGKTANHEVAIPNYIGAVRIMVVAGRDKAYGNAEKEIPVRSPVMVLGTLPRVLGPNERVSLPVNVFAMEPQIKDVSVTIETNDLVALSGNKTKKLHFDKTGDDLVFFDLTTSRKTGIGKISIEARSGKEVSRYEVEIDIRASNPHFTTVRDTVIGSGETWNASYTLFGVEGTNKAVIELSKLPALNLEKRLDFLIQYPHGCIEQITSGVFPQLYLNKMTDLTSAQHIEIEENVKYVLRAYRNYQRPGGGLSYWPGDRSESDWGTSYAGHFMLEAEKMGYALPAGLKSQWIKYQKSASRKWNSNEYRSRDYEQRIQSYRLYTLALAGEPDYGSMNVLKAQSSLNISARWILAFAYATAGQPEVAKNLVEGQVRDIPNYTELSYSYGSGLRDEGFVLQTLVALGMKTDAAMVAKEIAEGMGSNRWYSTQTVAFSLGALAAYMGDTKDSGLKATISQNGKPKEINTAKDLIQESLTVNGDKGSFTAKNNSGESMYARLLISGIPIEGKEERVASNLRMEIKYLDENYNPIDVSKLKMGTDFIANVTIINPGTRGRYQEMALTQIFPSGWEILNPRMSDANDAEGPKPTYQDIRDDRVMSYFDLGTGDRINFKIRLNATYHGRFYMPAIKCNAMYDESIIAIEPGKWIEVVE